MERVLVTGASGFLGHHLVGALLDRAIATIAHCRSPGPLARLAHPALRLVHGDLRDAESWRPALRDVDTVIHLAAARSRSDATPHALRSINEEATLALVRAATACGVRRIVVVGSAHVYGPSALPLAESSPLPERPLDEYLAARARGLRDLRALAAAGTPVVVVAPCIVFGPDHPSHPNVVTSYLRRIVRRPICFCIAGGRARRDLVHVDDVVRALLTAAEHPAIDGEELIVSGEPASQRELTTLAARSLGARAPLALSLPAGIARALAAALDRARGAPSGCGRANAVDTLTATWRFDDRKARRLLGHDPRPLAAAVGDTMRWLTNRDGHRD